MVKVTFSDDEMRDIIKMKESGKTYDQLSQVFKVSPSTIKRSIRNWYKANPPVRKTVDAFDPEVFKRMVTTAILDNKKLKENEYVLYFKAYYNNGRDLNTLAKGSGFDKDVIDRWVHTTLTGMDQVHYKKLWDNINGAQLF